MNVQHVEISTSCWCLDFELCNGGNVFWLTTTRYTWCPQVSSYAYCAGDRVYILLWTSFGQGAAVMGNDNNLLYVSQNNHITLAQNVGRCFTVSSLSTIQCNLLLQGSCRNSILKLRMRPSFISTPSTNGFSKWSSFQQTLVQNLLGLGRHCWAIAHDGSVGRVFGAQCDQGQVAVTLDDGSAAQWNLHEVLFYPAWHVPQRSYVLISALWQNEAAIAALRDQTT